ncbi:Os03g0760900 [Oryza sativa Japonica Group]|uniref:Os03g0760900 protein n=3 Tax=Oryza sativa TaxID=4530 RepID=C7IZH5_ORYSJ|nr:hypothetical protein [Oryza sativa Japonica Group]EAY91939.1 hypothetical protein OsI_13626 [Oryza sativa Indica Group]KAB8093685.1 hypothetical protein EE612_020594 [Oryza sativa]ABF99003.1 expressed protein [Oryza sativa Japonica Group]EAZ28664.1 hypothetical protein OsJ_12675 [Oryza sativa Japonica Group]|eukprot:NP_001173649.1 Os03g0760900 [Oryza sativa Japonica Group]
MAAAARDDDLGNGDLDDDLSNPRRRSRGRTEAEAVRPPIHAASPEAARLAETGGGERRTAGRIWRGRRSHRRRRHLDEAKTSTALSSSTIGGGGEPPVAGAAGETRVAGSEGGAWRRRAAVATFTKVAPSALLTASAAQGGRYRSSLRSPRWPSPVPVPHLAGGNKAKALLSDGDDDGELGQRMQASDDAPPSPWWQQHERRELVHGGDMQRQEGHEQGSGDGAAGGERGGKRWWGPQMASG